MKEPTSPPPSYELPAWLKETTWPEILAAGLALFLCFIAAVLGAAALYLRHDSRPEAAVKVVAAATATPTRAIPSPTPTTPSPPTASPQTVVTPEPTVAPTLVINPNQINEGKITEIAAFVEQWRQLDLSEDIPIDFLTRRQLQDKWQEQAFDQAIIETIRKRQAFYIAAGLVEPGIDLVQVSFDTQANLVLGYYTPTEKKMYIIAESVNMFAREEMTFAHEYTHALQDYHFDLSRLDNENNSSDTALAAHALPEGDARFVERLFTRQNINQDELDYDIYRYLFQPAPQVEGVSPALGVLAYFPYSAGEYFVSYLFAQGNNSWQLVNQAYHTPPLSSEQVMHPEKYLAGETPLPVNLPDLAPALGHTWREVDQDVLGEIGLLVWLSDKIPPQRATSSAAGWDGDSYTLWMDNANRYLLAELSIWESEAEANEFFNTFATYAILRDNNISLREENNLYLWESDIGLTLLQRQGRQALIIIAPDPVLLDDVRRLFGGF